MEQILTLNLTDAENTALKKSASAVQDLIAAMERIKSEA
jgi:hypothetical protein